MKYLRYHLLNLLWLTLGSLGLILSAGGILALYLFGFDFLRAIAVILNTYNTANCLHFFRHHRKFVRTCKQLDRDLAELKTLAGGIQQLRINCLAEQLEAGLSILERLSGRAAKKPEPETKP